MLDTRVPASIPPGVDDADGVAGAAVDGPRTDPGRSGRDREVVVTTIVLLATWGIVAWAFVWGQRILVDGPKVQLRFPPLTGLDDPNYPGTVVWAILAGLGAIAGFAAVIRRARWSVVLGSAGLAAIAWAVALTLIDGRDAFTTPLLSGQYIRTVPLVHDVGSFLSTFVERLPTYNIHTQGHPPGFVLVLWAMDRVGLGGVHANAVLVFLGGGVGVVAVLVAVRDVAGEVAARFAAPFVAIAPSAIWWSSGDAFFAGVAASAVACVVVATGRPGRAGDRLAVVGGLLFVATAYLSYGLVLMTVIPIAIGLARRAYRPLLVTAAVGALGVVAITVGTGFVWWDGLAATRERYFVGVASRRPYDYFLVGNLAVVLLAVGPAAVVACSRLRRSMLTVLVFAAWTAVALATVSGMAKGEVERIWLPFFPWIVAATAAFAPRVGRARVWFAVQILVTILLAVGVRSRW